MVFVELVIEGPPGLSVASPGRGDGSRRVGALQSRAQSGSVVNSQFVNRAANLSTYF